MYAAAGYGISAWSGFTDTGNNWHTLLEARIALYLTPELQGYYKQQCYYKQFIYKMKRCWFNNKVSSLCVWGDLFSTGDWNQRRSVECQCPYKTSLAAFSQNTSEKHGYQMMSLFSVTFMATSLGQFSDCGRIIVLFQYNGAEYVWTK